MSWDGGLSAARRAFDQWWGERLADQRLQRRINGRMLVVHVLLNGLEQPHFAKTRFCGELRRSHCVRRGFGESNILQNHGRFVVLNDKPCGLSEKALNPLHLSEGAQARKKDGGRR